MDEESLGGVVCVLPVLVKPAALPCSRETRIDPANRSSGERIQTAPTPAVTGDQQVDSLGTGASGWVVREVWRRQLCPCIFDGRNQTPFSFRFIAAREERRISPHGVKQQRFISYWTFSAKR